MLDKHFLIQTERLVLRPCHQSDFNDFYRFFSCKQNTKFIGGVKSKEQSWRQLAGYIGHYHIKGYSYFAVETKKENQFIGCVGLWNSEPWPEIELGYWLLPNFRNRGFAKESAQSIKHYAFYTLNIDALVSYIKPLNKASINLATQLGAIKENNIQLLDFGLHSVYRYSK